MIARLAHEAVALVVPPACVACRAPVARGDVRLCGACRRALPWLPAGSCPRCGLPGHGGRRCPAAAAAFARAWAPLAYEGVARDLVHALKFRGALPVARVMAAHLAANLPRDLRGLPLVPVPPQPLRRRARGFDPAATLAAELARRLGVAVEPHVLRRRDHAPRQVGASRRARRHGGRLRVESRGAPPPRVLLLDDVHTTGATLEACARVLRAGGCREVAAVTYCRTL